MNSYLGVLGSADVYAGDYVSLEVFMGAGLEALVPRLGAATVGLCYSYLIPIVLLPPCCHYTHRVARGSLAWLLFRSVL